MTPNPKVMEGFSDELTKLGAGWGIPGAIASGAGKAGGAALKFMTHSKGKLSLGRSLTSAYLGGSAISAAGKGIKGIRQPSTGTGSGTLQQFKNPYYLY